MPLGIGAAFTCEALNLDCHIVQGYKSSADAGLSVTRGEMDAVYVPEMAIDIAAEAAFGTKETGKDSGFLLLERMRSHRPMVRRQRCKGRRQFQQCNA